MKKEPSLQCSVTTCFVEYNKKFLMLQRNRQDAQFGLWGIPGGKLDAGESSESALVRELKEELNLSCSQSELEFLDNTVVKNPHDGRYELFLYYLHLDSPPEISISKIEHSAYQWVSIDEFKNLDLLYSQGLAFDFVAKKLFDKLNTRRNFIHA